MDERVCLICGAELPKGRSKYCSEQCGEKADKMRARENYKQIRGRRGVFRTGLVCMDCGCTYDGTIKTKRCPACQEEADRRHTAEYRARASVGAQRKLGSTDLCERCGKPYTVESGLQRYCKACAHVATKENINEHKREFCKKYYANPERAQEKREAKKVKKRQIETCPICGKQFESRYGAKYCSDECRRERARRNDQTPERLAKHNEYTKRKRQTEEGKAEINRRQRENYAKRKARAKEDSGNQT